MVTEFQKRVYVLCRKIPLGKVTTYKEIGKALGKGQVYRAVGRALRENPFTPEVPCHRVVCSDGKIGGFKGKTEGKEVEEKIKLLKREGVEIINGKIDLKKFLAKLTLPPLTKDLSGFGLAKSFRVPFQRDKKTRNFS